MLRFYHKLYKCQGIEGLRQKAILSTLTLALY